MLEKIKTYLQDNLTYVYVALGALAFVILLIVVCAIFKGRKKKAAKSAQMEKETAPEEGSEPSVTEEPTEKEEPSTQTEEPVKEEPAPAEEEKSAPVAEKKEEKEEGEEEISTGLNGKWRIEETADGFVASLYASNGVLMLSSEPYTSFRGAKNGIETIKKNAELGSFQIKEDKNGRFSFKLLSAQKRLICIGASYNSKASCESAIESVKNFAKTAILVSTEAKPKSDNVNFATIR